MGSRPVGRWCSLSSMPGARRDRTGSRSTKPVARGPKKPISSWRAMAGAGGQLREGGMSRESPHLIVVADADALAKAAAERVLARVGHAGGRLAVCLTGGSTPQRLYELMATEPYRSALPWNLIHWFWGD